MLVNTSSLKRLGNASISYSRHFHVHMNSIYWNSKRICCTTTSARSFEENFSKSMMKDMIPDRKILQHLDKLHLGFCSKRRMRVAVAKNYEKKNGMGKTRPSSRVSYGSTTDGFKAKQPPYPFDSVGRKVLNVSSADEIRNNITTPEVAIVGRSNVGKSTLINQLLGFDSSYVQKSQVSNKPGETRNLHLFVLGKKRLSVKESDINTINNNSKNIECKNSGNSLIISDMPGFGFAFMNDQEKVRCENLILSYLTRRGQNLKRVVLLLDARHGFKMSDIQFLNGLFNVIDEQNRKPLEAGMASKKRDVIWKMQIVLTKCDLVERRELARRLQLIREQMYDIIPTRYGGLQLLAISGKQNKGVLELQQELAALVPIK